MTEIDRWLRSHGLDAYSEIFAAERINTDILGSLSEDDLARLGIPLGDRKRFMRALSQLSASAVERRQLTVLICDMVDSTELSSRLDAETYREMLHQFRSINTRNIELYEGYIYQHRGDNTIAYFGYPRAQEQNASRAASAAMALLEDMARFNQSRGSLPPLQARVGIATGPVIVGAELDEGRLHENAVGVTPNLAGRLQALAPPGSALVCDLTWRLLKGHFEGHALPDQTLKGIDEPVTVYQLTGTRQVQPIDAQVQNQQLSPFTGREAAMQILVDCWSGDTQRFVFISGEAGIGKSRLVREFRNLLSAQGSPVQAYYCSPFHCNTSLYPVAQSMRRVLPDAPDSDPESAMAELRGYFATLGIEAADRQEALADLLGFGSSADSGPHESRQRKQVLLETIVHMLRHSAAADKVLLLIEDMHWVDPSTVELLSLILRELDGLNCLVVMTARPEYDWPDAETVQPLRLSLGALTAENSMQLVRQLLQNEVCSETVIQEIIDKTAGIPLYIEETTHAVYEARHDRQPGEPAGAAPRLKVPPTLTDSLMARLDRLGSTKFTALVASVIGQEFSPELIEAVMGASHQGVRRDLAQLVRNGTLKSRNTGRNRRYTFKHGLLQDVAYDSLLTNTRNKLHSEIADALTGDGLGLFNPEPELIAHHLTICGRREEGAAYWMQAGQAASARSALQEAVVHFRTALDLLEALPETPERIKTKLRVLQGMAGPLLGITSYRSPEVKQVANLAIKLCKQSEFQKDLPVFLYTIWIGEQGDGNHRYALTLAQDFLTMSRQHNDRTSQMVAHRAAAWSELNLGNLERAQSHLSSSRTLYDSSQHDDLLFTYGTDQLIGIGCGEVQTVWALGYPDSALRIAETTVNIAEHKNLAMSRFLAYQYSGCLINSLCRRWDEAADFAERLISVGTSNKLPQSALAGAYYRDMLAVVKHGSVASWESAMNMIQTARQLGYLYMMPMWYTLLADACLKASLLEQARRSLIEAEAIVQKTEEHWYLAEILRIGAELEFAETQGFSADCDSKLREAIRIAAKQNGKSWELRARTSLIRLQPHANQDDHQAFEQCLVWFSEGKTLPDYQSAHGLRKGYRADLRS